MKNLIIGAFTGYDYGIVRPWVKSAISVKHMEGNAETDVVLCVGKTDVETLEAIALDGVTIVNMEDMGNIPVHVFRFIYIYEYLRHNWQNYKYVVTTDVRDVIFQRSPFDWLDSNLYGMKLVASSESMRYKDEPWGNQNLYETYGPTIYEQFKDNVIYNVGTLGGWSEYIKDLALNIAVNSINRPIPIVDQAVYNVLINTQPYKGVTQFTPMNEGWACQAGTAVDPHKIEYFRPKLLEPEPVFHEGLVYTSTGKQFAIVHQYDRVPEWRAIIEAKYV